jgi:outer membrane protein assembly factor BamB
LYDALNRGRIEVKTIVNLLADNGTVYAAGDNGTDIALDATTGKILWTRPMPDSNLLTAVTDGVLFATDSADSIAFGLNAATGTVEWTYPSAG